MRPSTRFKACRPSTAPGARRHTATVDHPGGGEFANIASNGIRWQVKGDKEAAKMFVGKDCSLCTNANSVTRSKRLE